MYEVGRLEKPVGILRVFTFLLESDRATITDFIAHGWNRRTADRSLRELLSLGLLDRTRTSQFPTFRKEYFLSATGANVARFVDLVKIACQECKDLPFREASRLPAGCMRILVYLSRRGWRGTSDLLKETGLNANQAYRCLEELDERGVLVVGKGHSDRARIFLCEPTPGAHSLLAAVDALEGALERASLSRAERRI